MWASPVRVAEASESGHLDRAGAQAAFCCDLAQKGENRGRLVVYNRTPGFLPAGACMALTQLAAALVQRLYRNRLRPRPRAALHLRRLERNLATALRQNRGVEETIRIRLPGLNSCLGADGCILRYRGKLFTFGRTPPRDVIDHLLDWVQQRPDASTGFETRCLPVLWPPAVKHARCASGIMVRPLSQRDTEDKAIWFRGQARTLDE